MRQFQVFSPVTSLSILASGYRLLHPLNKVRLLLHRGTDHRPNEKKNNPKYKNAAHAFILLFFDDCTIFEKTEKQKSVKPKNIFSDL